MEKNSGFATKQIHTGKIEIPGIAPLATPIFQTSTFEFETTAQGAHRFAGEEAGYIYTRLGNPNTTKIGEKLAALEHALCSYNKISMGLAEKENKGLLI